MASISFKHRAEYLLLRLIAAIVRRLPRRTALAAGAVVGRLGMRVLPGRYRLARENLRRALPDMDSETLENCLRKNFEHFGICGIEMLRLDMFRSGSEDLKRYVDVEGTELLREALDLNRGVLLLTAHLGFWEVGAFVLPELGIPFDVVAKPLRNPLADRYFEKIRTSFGTEVIDSHNGARRILKSLQAGRVVGVLLDQHISPPGSVMTKFFGRKAYTTTAITNMAMKYQIPVIPMFCLRQPDNRYKIWVEPMLLLSGKGDHAVAANTQLLTDRIEQAVRRDISQWFWMHKRWRVKSRVRKGGEK